MNTPRLTIGIPTHDRPEMLVRAVRSALNQTVPVHVLISDDSETGYTSSVIREHFSEDVGANRIHWRRLRDTTDKAGLWANWDNVARHCRTEFFLWLQDDDVVLPHVAARVVSAFDQFPEADTWLACNKIAPDDRHHWWNNGNGPWVPLRADGAIDQWECEIFTPTCYFLAWSLSPAVAFRCGLNFTGALNTMPDCPIFAERLILVGMKGRFIADPCVAGLWIQHANNEHRKLHADQPRQTEILIRKLDEAMDQIDGWREILDTWARMQHPHWIMGWLGDLDHAEREGGKSRYGEAIREVLIKSLEGRVKYMPIYKWWYKPIAWLRKRAAL